MIADKFLQIDPITGASYLMIKARETAAKDFEVIKKKFLNARAAYSFLNQYRKQVYTKQLITYITHCENIIVNSNIPQPNKRKSLENCQMLRDYARGKNGEKTLKEVAKFSMMNLRHLKAVLPHENNISHNVAAENLNEIIRQAEHYSQVKRCSQIE
jgi:hypothetical protein